MKHFLKNPCLTIFVITMLMFTVTGCGSGETTVRSASTDEKEIGYVSEKLTQAPDKESETQKPTKTPEPTEVTEEERSSYIVEYGDTPEPWRKYDSHEVKIGDLTCQIPDRLGDYEYHKNEGGESFVYYTDEYIVEIDKYEVDLEINEENAKEVIDEYAELLELDDYQLMYLDMTTLPCDGRDAFYGTYLGKFANATVTIISYFFVNNDSKLVSFTTIGRDGGSEYWKILWYMINSIEFIEPETLKQTETPTPEPTLTSEPTPEPVVAPEIFFRGIPWGTKYGEVQSILSELSFMTINGEGFKTYSQDDILLGDYEGIDFKESGFNYICSSYDETEVAGYTTKEIDIYGVMPVENGKLNHDENSAVIYGASYEFEVRDIEAMTNDIVNKMTQLYGEPTVEKKLQNWSADEVICYIWEGSNAYASVRAEDYPEDWGEDSLYINYVSRDADKWLQSANDAMAKEKNEAEAEHYGNDDTSGL